MSLQLATELRLSQATTYRLIGLFREGGSVRALVERKRGRPLGHRVLDPRRDELVKSAIRAIFLTPNRPPFSELVRMIQARCMKAGLKPPHRGAYQGCQPATPRQAGVQER